MTFKEYLLARRPTADALGDLGRLAAAEGFPEIESREQLYTYIVGRYGNGHLGESIDLVWKAYEVAKLKMGKS